MSLFAIESFQPRLPDFGEPQSTVRVAWSFICWYDDEKVKVLVGERTDSGRLTFPGGKIERNETSLAAARRETLEETGINLTDHELYPLTAVSFSVGEDYIFSLPYLCIYDPVSMGEPVVREWQHRNWGWTDFSDIQRAVVKRRLPYQVLGGNSMDFALDKIWEEKVYESDPLVQRFSYSPVPGDFEWAFEVGRSEFKRRILGA